MLSVLDKFPSPGELQSQTMATVLEASQHFEREILLEFTQAVCKIAARDLKEKSPRLFLLEQLTFIAYYNIDRPYFIWVSLWRVLDEQLRRIATAPSDTIATLGINVLRSLAERFLGNPKLSSYRFQKQFMKTFLDVFNAQKSERSRIYLLQSIGGIVRDSGASLKDGWPSVLQILHQSEPETALQPHGFQILTEVVLHNLAFAESYLRLVIETVSGYARRAKRTDASFFAPICELLEGSSDLWPVLFHAILNEKVFRDVLLTAVSKPISDKYFGPVFEKDITRFYTEHSGNFFTRVFEDIVEAHFDVFANKTGLLVQWITKAIQSRHPELALAGLSAFEAFAKNHMQQSEIEPVLGSVGTLIASFTVGNALAFLNVVENLSANLADAGIKYFEMAKDAKFANQADSGIVSATSRLKIQKCLTQNPEFSTEQISTNMREILELYIGSGALEADPKVGKFWHDLGASVFGLMNQLQGEKFSACFQRSADLIVKLVVSAPKTVRVEIAAALQRTLVPE
jgi:hypothetical protein